MTNKLTYKEVKERSRRPDSTMNNRIHWFAHRFSSYFTYVFLRLNMSADAVTIVFFMVGLSGAICTYFGGTMWCILGYILWRMHVIIDMSDGDVARFHQSFSHRGKYWDSMIHSILNPLYCFLIPFGIFDRTADLRFLYLAILLLFSQSILLATKYTYPKSGKTIPNQQDDSQFDKNESISSFVKRQASEIIGMEGFVLISLLTATVGHSRHLVWVFSAYIFFNFTVAFIKFYHFSYYGKTYSKFDR